MGVIRRQSLKHVFVNLAGLFVGAASTFLVYPHVREEFGLVQVLLQIGLLGLPLMSMGANTVALRFFPKFQDKEKGHNGFLPLLFVLCAAGFLFSALLALVAWEPYLRSVETRSPLIRQYLWMGFPMAFFYVLSTVLAAYSANFKRIVVPSILLDFSQKLVLPAVMIAVWQTWIPLDTALWCVMIHSCCVTIGMVLYLRSLGEWHWRPNWSFLDAGLRKELLSYTLFWTLGGFALLIAAKSDIFMVGSLSAVKAAGTFTIAAALAAIIELPIKSLYSASASSVARHLADGDMEALDKLYKSVSINLLVAGLLLFGCLWTSIESIFQFFPKDHAGEMATGIWVFFFIALSRLVEMSTGLNNNMIYYSPHYKFALLSLSLAAALTIGLNLWLTPILGYTAAAVATLASITFYNAFSVWLVWLKFKLFPFTRSTLESILWALLSYACSTWIPATGINLLDIVLRSAVFCVVFLPAVLLRRLSPDLNALWELGLSRMKRFVDLLMR